MMNAWVAFAASGNPNAMGLPRWARYDARSDNYLGFGDRIESGSGWRKPQLDFLDRFYDRQQAG